MQRQTIAQSAVYRVAQCNQRGVTLSETNIARSVCFLFAIFASFSHGARHYPLGLKIGPLRLDNVIQCSES